jgi:hypothetical protein
VVAALKQRAARSLREQAQAQHGYEVADAEVLRVVTALRSEFGVESVQEAQDLLARLHGDTLQAVGEVERS